VLKRPRLRTHHHKPQHYYYLSCSVLSFAVSCNRCSCSNPVLLGMHDITCHHRQGGLVAAYSGHDRLGSLLSVVYQSHFPGF
jgi:hypothetical protein